MLPGFGELMRAVSLRVVPTAILSRQTACVRGHSLIVNLPGKPSAIAECLDAVFPAIPYCIDLIGGPRLETAPFAKGKIPNRGSPGGTLTVSSNGKQPGTGIVWATHTRNKSADAGNAPGVLRAFNAETLQEIWNSEQRPKRDRLGTLMKFVPPLVVGGKVYVPNYDGAVNVYGLLSP